MTLVGPSTFTEARGLTGKIGEAGRRPLPGAFLADDEPIEWDAQVMMNRWRAEEVERRMREFYSWRADLWTFAPVLAVAVVVLLLWFISSKS